MKLDVTSGLPVQGRRTRTTGWRALLPGPLKLSFRGMGGCAAGGGGCAAGAGGVGGAAGAGSGGCAAIEVGRNEVWERVFVGDEIIKYVDSSFCRKDCRYRILCSFEGVRDIEGRETMLYRIRAGSSWLW